MKVFLSALENSSANDGTPIARYLVNSGIKMKWNLMSYYYIQSGKKLDIGTFVRDNSELVMIDSGAHSFQFGKKVNFVEYTKKYAEFIKNFDRPNVVGFFEMDIDNVIGYDKTLELRKILEDASDKIIPVWHYNRGIENFEEMCEKYRGRTISITGFKNKDIADEQYIMFVKKAREYDCKIHCLGMTRKAILDRVPFDYVDSSTWVQQSVYGRIGKRKVPMAVSKTQREIVFRENYILGMQMQRHYYQKWRKECRR